MPDTTPVHIDRRALIAVLLAVALATLDTAIANTALPAVAADLNAPPAASIWVINAYQLAVVASLVLLAGARALQGVGAGALMSVNIALIRAICPSERLGRGVGLNALVVAVMAPIAGRMSDHHPPGLLGGVGLALLSAGLTALALLPEHPQVLDIVWRMALCGAGFGFFQSPNLRALMASAPPERSGGASGVIAIARLLGQTTGAALVALCFGLAGAAGPTWALALGAVSAALSAIASTARLWAR